MSTINNSVNNSLTIPVIITSLFDVNSNTWIAQTATSSAVNYITVKNNVTTASPAISATGTDSSIILTLSGKGSGGVTIAGTSSADNAASGYVGEYITSNIPDASAVSLSNNTAVDVTSISLTAGDWEIFGNVSFTFGASTAVSNVICWTSNASATLPDNSKRSYYADNVTGVAANIALATPYLRINSTGTTTAYLTAYCSFTTSTATASGSIFARRVR